MELSKESKVAHVRRSSSGEVLALQSLEEHLRNVGDLAATYAAKADMPLAGRLMGLVHDFGKYSEAFQKYISSAAGLLAPGEPGYMDPVANKGKVNHSFAGGQHIWKSLGGSNKKRGVAQLLALCVLSHHSGLKDCITPEGAEAFTSDYMARCEEKTHHDQCASTCDTAVAADIAALLSDGTLLETLRALQKLEQRVISRLPHNSDTQDEQDCANSRDFQQGLLARFLFSCLLDADRTDSADFDDPQLALQRAQAPRRPWDALVPRLEAALAEKTPLYAIDHLRRDISAHCARRALDKQGVFTLTVPTGGGKTLSSLRFALLHAQKHQLDRIFYIIPYTSIIDQNADVVRKILEQNEIPGSIVLEHHSNFLPDTDTEDEGAAKKRERLAENWDAPVVFTTMVQFLESLFGSGTRHARRMHNLARSVIIFDEAQTVPVRCLRMFCNSLDFLVNQCGSTAVLCTATQPRLGNLPRPFLGNIPVGPQNEIMPDVPKLFTSLKRTVFFDHCHTGMSIENVAALAREELQSSGSCLVVCNTKKTAEKIYALCPASEGQHRYYLSTSLCPAHRMEKLEAMRADLAAGLPVLCVSTQLIECGVDISFRSVVRVAAGLDSILQAAGRCNRHGESEPGRVHVVRVDADVESLACLQDIRDGREVFLNIVRPAFADANPESGCDLTMPELTETYFDHYFHSRGNVMSYATGDGGCLLHMLGSNAAVRDKSLFPMLGQSFASASAAFKAIDSAATSIVVPYGNGKNILADLLSADAMYRKKELLRKAQRYSVNIFPNIKKIISKNSGLYYYDNCCVIVLQESFYDAEMGVVTQPRANLGLSLM